MRCDATPRDRSLSIDHSLLQLLLLLLLLMMMMMMIAFVFLCRMAGL